MNLRQLKNIPWPKEEQDGFITLYDSSKEAKDDPRDTIRKFCDELKEKMLAKWEAGANEHKGDWREVDCWREVQLEIIDCCNYICMDKTKK